jgi:hypothetical protein
MIVPDNRKSPVWNPVSEGISLYDVIFFTE